MSEPIYREFKKPKKDRERKRKDTTLRDEYKSYIESHKKPWYLQ